jgi:hypothetical protein
VTRARIAWSVFATLACIGGCAQVLGLGSYGEAPDGGEGGATQEAASAADGGVSGTPKDGATNALDELAADARTGGATDGSDAGNAEGAADGSCTGATTCAPSVPAGWTGPLALWEGTINPPASCPTGFSAAFDGGAAASSPPAQCSCACTPATGGACGPVTLTFTANGGGGCGQPCGPGGGVVSVTPGSCVSVSTITQSCGNTNVTISGSAAAGCTPNASATTPPWAWGAYAVACAPLSSTPLGCPAGGLCVPAPPSPFEMRFCIMQPGSGLTCPGAYPVQRSYYSGVTDTRGCSTCTCGGVDCNANAHVQTWNSSQCTGTFPLADFNPLPKSCSSVSNQPRGVSFTTSPRGTCAPVGGQPIGSVATQGPVTLCCTP